MNTIMVVIKFVISYHFHEMEGVLCYGWVPAQLT